MIESHELRNDAFRLRELYKVAYRRKCAIRLLGSESELDDWHEHPCKEGRDPIRDVVESLRTAAERLELAADELDYARQSRSTGASSLCEVRR